MFLYYTFLFACVTSVYLKALSLTCLKALSLPCYDTVFAFKIGYSLLNLLFNLQILNVLGIF